MTPQELESMVREIASQNISGAKWKAVKLIRKEASLSVGDAVEYYYKIMSTEKTYTREEVVSILESYQTHFSNAFILGCGKAAESILKIDKEWFNLNYPNHG